MQEPVAQLSPSPMPAQQRLVYLFFPLLALLPLIVSPAIVLSFDDIFLTPKLQFIGWVLGPAGLYLLFCLRHHLDRRIAGAALLWCGLLTVSTLVNGASPDNLLGLAGRADGLLMHLFYTLSLLCGALYAQLSGTRRIVTWGLLGSATVAAISGILQQLHLVGVPSYATQGITAMMFGGLLGNPGYMGGFLSLSFPVAVASLPQLPARHRWLGQGAVVLITWGLLGTLSRGVWLAAALSLVWLLWQTRPRWVTLWPLAVGVALWGASSLIHSNSRDFSHVNLIHSNGRASLWGAAVQGIEARPLTGWGSRGLFENLNRQVPEVVLRDYSAQPLVSYRRLNTSSSEPPTFIATYAGQEPRLVSASISKVHNEYLDYALTYGVPAALFFIAMLMAAIWHSRRGASGISAGLLAYAAFLMTWPDTVRFTPVAWFLMGFALCYMNRTGKCSPASERRMLER